MTTKNDESATVKYTQEETPAYVQSGNLRNTKCQVHNLQPS